MRHLTEHGPKFCHADYKKYSLGPTRNIFDMAKGDVMSVIKIQEDKDFLLDQRSTRKLFIGGTDKEFEAKCKNKAKKQEDFERRRQKSREDINRLMQTAAGDEVHSSSSKASSSADDTVDDNYEPPLKPQRSRSPLYPPASVNRRRRVIDDPLFVASSSHVTEPEFLRGPHAHCTGISYQRNGCQMYFHFLR